MLLQGRDSWDLLVTSSVALGKILHILMPQLAGKSVKVLINMEETRRELSEKHNFVIITFLFGLVDTSLAPIDQIPNTPVLKKIKWVLYKVRILLQIIESSQSRNLQKEATRIPTSPLSQCCLVFLPS